VNIEKKIRLFCFFILSPLIFSNSSFANKVFVVEGKHIVSRGALQNPHGTLWELEEPNEIPLKALNYKDGAIILFENTSNNTKNVKLETFTGAPKSLATGWQILSDIAYIDNNIYLVTPAGNLYRRNLNNPNNKFNALEKLQAGSAISPIGNVQKMIAVGQNLILLKNDGTLLNANIDASGDVVHIQPFTSMFPQGLIASVDNNNFLIFHNGTLYQGDVENNIRALGAFVDGMPILEGTAFIKDTSLYFLPKGELQILYAGKDIAIRYYDFGSDTINIVFASAKPPADTRTALDEGTSEKYFIKRKESVIFVNNMENHWWQSLEMFQVLSSLKEIRGKYPHATHFGSSMGGFGSLVFSNELKPERVVAFASQVILEKFQLFRDYKTQLKFDTLFAIGFGLYPEAEYFVFYAEKHQHDRDAIVIDLERIRVSKGIQKFHPYPVPLKEHGILPPLLKLGYLAPISSAALQGDFAALDLLLERGGTAWKVIEGYKPQ